MTQSIYSLPIYFSVKNEISHKDERFLEVEIDVLHEGLNFNKSIFSKDVVNKNIDTIKNTPILGFVRELPDGENDFKGHEYIITKTDRNGLTRKYIGSAFGLIPESCDAHWISKISEDGQERDYLRVNGLLWTKFTDSIDIMMRDIDKPHSMELFPNNIDGYENEDGNFVFTSFSFDGCCILGSTDDIQPAMISSNIKVKDFEVQFTMSDFVRSIQNELNDKYSAFTKLVNDTTFTNSSEKVNENNKGGITTMDNTDFSTVLQMFNDISNTIAQHEMMEDRWGDKYSRYYAVDIQGDEVIVVDRMNNYNYFAFPFTMNGDSCEIDFENCKRKKISYEDYVDGEVVPEGAFDFGKHIEEIESNAFTKVEEANAKVSEAEGKVSEYETKVSEFETAKNEIEEKYNQINAEFEEMKPKYEDFVKAEQARIDAELEAQKDAEFAKYETVMSDDPDFAALKDKKSEMTIKEIESECAIMYARKNLAQTNFSKSNEGVMTAGLIQKDEKEGFVYSERYGYVPTKR